MFSKVKCLIWNYHKVLKKYLGVLKSHVSELSLNTLSYYLQVKKMYVMFMLAIVHLKIYFDLFFEYGC